MAHIFEHDNQYIARLTDFIHVEYRSTVYTYEEVLKIIKKYGMPQDKWDKLMFAQPCYVEAQVWSDEPALQYKKEWEAKVKNI